MSSEEPAPLKKQTEQARTLDDVLNALRKSEQRYRSLVAATSQVVWTTDAEGRVVDMPQWRALTGQSVDDVRGWGWLKAVHPEDRERTRVVWSEAVGTRGLYQTEYRIRGADGSYRHYAARGVPVIEPDGSIREWVGTCTDITDRIEAGEALRQTNQALQAIIQAAPLAIVTLDTDGHVLTWNPAAERIYGWTAEEAVGRVLPTIPEDKAEEFTANQKSAMRGQVFSAYETRRQRKDGTPVEVSISTAPLMDAAGGIQGVVALVTDITERKRADQLIRESDERALRDYQQLVERIATLAQALGAARDLVTIFRALRGFAEASVPCIGIFISLYDSQRDVRTAVYAWGDGEEVDVSLLPPMPITVEGPNSRAVRTGQIIFTDDYQSRTEGHPGVLIGPPDGKLPNSSLAVPMAAMGRIVGTIEVQSYEMAAYNSQHAAAMRMAANLAAVAIENVRLFEHESRARGAAEESNRLKDEFLAILSHELRTPLTAVLGWARMLRSEHLNSETTERALEVIERNATVQKHLIDDLLEVSRIITGKFRLKMRPMSLAPVVEAAIEVIRPTADAKNIHIQSALKASPSGVVSGDPDRVQQVVWNLLSNAVKFTPHGGRIEVRLEHESDCTRIVVSDTGQGIPESFLPFVFDRFRQADSTTTRTYGGLGLGLAIVRHLVELHGGTVRVESEGEGRGATFSVELPLNQTRAAKSTTAEGENQRADPEDNSEQSTIRNPQSAILQSVRVLIVEDDDDTCQLLARLLERRGAEVTAVSSSAAAIASLEESWPDVMISDIGMPGEDGYALIRRARALGAKRGVELPAVALTAYAGDDDRKRALLAGFQTHVPKPVEPSELIEIVASLAGRVRENHQE
ncbi:MAG TPA: PAS domain S-box protein [Pyrinomonadaceae bacterium]|jgi:PAS domain S-box-containing protein|nr:PAS domain S-box protein [Pyrinomonadaceae bacterium]